MNTNLDERCSCSAGVSTIKTYTNKSRNWKYQGHSIFTSILFCSAQIFFK